MIRNLLTVVRSALDGAFPNEPEAYKMAPTLAGINHVFAAPAAACDNCARQGEDHLVIGNTKPITSMLLDYVKIGKLANLQPDVVVPFLRSNLDWRVIGVSLSIEHLGLCQWFATELSQINRQPTPSDQVAGLMVSVTSVVSYALADTVVPEEIGSQQYPEITAGRAGGLGSTE